MRNKKERMVTGVQPTGNFTLANYIGAIKNFVKLQNKYESYIFIADMHGVTSYKDPEEIHKTILDFVAIYLACGVDPKYTNFFVQSDINEHGMLGFLIAFQCRVGELSRMTQYKSKKEKIGNNGVNLGLFIYPTLMAADILLYDAKVVPVGMDQKQHIEMTRNLGERFNKRFGDTFELPDYYIPKIGAKIMNLQNPLEKMSKSVNKDDKGTIFILDNVDITRKKIMSAVTDSDNFVKFDEENKPGISNLISILSVISNKDIQTIEKEYKNSNYGEFKKDVADTICIFISKLQENYNYFRNGSELKDILISGAENVKKVASSKLEEVRNKMGIHY
jgi:tryptophanyl-tRNA synthetase